MPQRPRLTPAIADVRRAVREAWMRHGVVSGDCILVACSGGADSLALAAASVFVQGGAFTVGPEAVAVFAGAAVGRWRGNLLLGMVVSVLVVLTLRATLAA